MNKKGLLTGVSVVASAASLAVASTALATQPTTEEIVIPIPLEGESLKADKVQGMIQDAAEQTKKEINEAKGKDIEDIKQTAEEAFEQATRATFELAEITDQMNTNIEIYNEDLRTISKQLEENKQLLQKLSEKMDNHKQETEMKWNNFETKYQEIKELEEYMKGVKEIHDVGEAYKYVTKTVQNYMKEKVDIANKFQVLQEEFEELKKNLPKVPQ